MVGRTLAIIVPMLGRPHRVLPVVDSVWAATPNARLLFVLSPHDTPVREEVDRLGQEHITVPYQSWGDYARKINAGYRHTTEDVIFTGADDLDYQPGWYEAACARLGDGIGVVGTNDLGNPRVLAGLHSTHSLVTRDYADRYGTIDQRGQIYTEIYWHEFVDDELVGTAKHRGAWAMASDAIVAHLHPNWRADVPTDGLYRQQQMRMRRCSRLYQQRRRMWT